jgi:N-acetylneuraminic acid mutarotase
LTATNGPASGSNSLTITGTGLGNGSDITNGTICGVTAIIQSQSPDSVTVLLGAGQASVGDILVYSATCGITTFVNGYTYLPPTPSALPATNVTVNSFFANWSAATGITNYLLDLSQASNFTAFVTGYSNKSVGNVTTCPVAGLNAAATYFYRVRSQDNGISSTNSSTASVHTSGALSVSNGPAAGGNTLTITGTGLGSGSDITNVTICGVVAAIQNQTANSVTVVASASEGGTGEVQAFSSSCGLTTFVNGYTYRPPGHIFGSFTGWSYIPGLPDMRYLAGASAGGVVCAIGGFGNNANTPHPLFYDYDPLQPAQGWFGVSDPVRPATYDQAATSCNGKIYAIGGIEAISYSILSSCYVYDPANPSQKFSSIGGPNLLYGLAAASANGKIYAIGGIGWAGNTYPGPITDAVSVYDTTRPDQGWLSVSNLPAPRAYLAAASLNGKIYAIGGFDGTNVQSTVFVYDPSHPTQGWLTVSSLPGPRGRLAAASLNGKIYAIGGGDYWIGDGGWGTSSVYAYDPSQPELGWSYEFGLWKSTYGLGAASANGRLYTIGGNASSSAEGTFASGIVPSTGSPLGANMVTITGSYLGCGDVTNVTLCGIPAAILVDHSPTQIVVSAGSAPFGTNGDVAVYSSSYGTTVKPNGYTYLQTRLEPLPATNLTLNSFYANWTSVPGATNYLIDVSTTSNFDSFLPGSSNLSVGNATTCRITELNTGCRYYYRVRYQKDGIASDSSVTVAAQTASASVTVSNGPASGGNTLTITGTGLGNGSDITNVMICGVRALVQAQTADSVTVLVSNGEAGTGDIGVYSGNSGITIIANGYTYKQPGCILGPFLGWLNVNDSELPRSRSAFAAAGGKIYAIGGWKNGYYEQSAVYAYDPSLPAQGWLSVSNLPSALMDHAAATVNGKIYALGSSLTPTVFGFIREVPVWIAGGKLHV